MASNETLLTISEAAKRLEVAPPTVRRWIEQKRLEAVPFPSGRFRVRREEVDRILAGRSVTDAGA